MNDLLHLNVSVFLIFFITCGMVFIRLYRCTSSSLVGMRCCPFPIPARGNTQTVTRSQNQSHSSFEKPTDGGFIVQTGDFLLTFPQRFALLRSNIYIFPPSLH